MSIRDLGYDLHAHLLPAVDDGVRDVDEAIAAIRGLTELGFSGCILTPHIYRGVHDNTAVALADTYRSFVIELNARGVHFSLRLAAEYFGDRHLIELAASAPLLSFKMAGANCVLIEFPYISEPLDFGDVLSAVCRAGYQPVIAHPERYRYFGAEIDKWIGRFGLYDVQYQCEIGSLGGQYGPGPERVALQLRKRGLAALWGSDLHRPAHVERFLRRGVKKLKPRGLLNPALEVM